MDPILLPLNISATQRERFPKRVTYVPSPENVQGDCIVWTGAKAAGYGVYNVRGKLFSLHRQTWIDHRGPLEDWQQIDHLCRNRACFNLLHLEPVSQAENGYRGEGPQARHRLQTHCEHNHPLSGENLRIYVDTSGRQHRACVTCHKRRAREQYQRNLAKKESN